MEKVKKILVAFDFFDSTKCAVVRADYLAKYFGACIVPVHAVEYIPYHYGLNYWHKIHDELYPRIEATFNLLVEKGVPVRKPIIREGRPYNVLLAAADELEVDLIVVGCRRRGLTERLFGSTALKIIRNAHQPVMIVDCDLSKVSIKKILCAVDFSMASRRVVNSALFIAKRLEAELTLLHVTQKSRSYPGLSKLKLPVVDLEVRQEFNTVEPKLTTGTRNYVQQKVRVEFKKYLSEFDLTGVDYKIELRHGNPAEEISKIANLEDFDLLVLGTQGQSNSSKVRIGDTTEKVIHKVKCSLLTVKFPQNMDCLAKAPRKDILESSKGFSDKTEPLENRILEIETFELHARKLLRENRCDLAIQEFEKCVNLDSHYFPAYEGLAYAYEILDDPEKAKMNSDLASKYRRSSLKLLIDNQKTVRERFPLSQEPEK